MSYSNSWEQAEVALRVADRVFIGGTPAAGKTYLATNYGLKDGQKVYSLTVTPDMGVLSVLGGMMPNEKGTFSFVGGPVYRAMTEGARLVINEIALASSDVYALLLGACDSKDSAFITLPNNEMLRPAPGYQVVATSNSRLEEMEEPLQTRFPVGLWVEKPNPKAFEVFPPAMRGLVQDTIGSVASDAGDRVISLRHWIEIKHVIETNGKSADALLVAKSILGNTMAVHAWRAM